MKVHAVTVCPDRVDVVVGVDGAQMMRTSSIPGLAERALEILPTLERHLCDNPASRPFAEEIADTEIPHLFEHVIMEIMALAGSPRTLRGQTRWDFRRDGRGVFRVSVEYDDDLVCLGSIKLANQVMQHLIGSADAPDVQSETARLRSLRQRAAS